MIIDGNKLKSLELALRPGAQAALEDEYGSLENALIHFQERFGEFAPRIMAETAPGFLDPIVLRTPAGHGFNFLREHMRRPWSLTDPRPGSMTALMAKRGLLVFTPDGRAKLDFSMPGDERLIREEAANAADTSGKVATEPEKAPPTGSRDRSRSAGRTKRKAG